MKETVYEHLDGRDTFTVTAAERKSVGMIRRLKEKFPDEVEIVAENADGSLVAHLPESWMRIVPKRKVELSEERRAEIGARLRGSRNQYK